MGVENCDWLNGGLDFEEMINAAPISRGCHTVIQRYELGSLNRLVNIPKPKSAASINQK